jgi:hypothetical protein
MAARNTKETGPPDNRRPRFTMSEVATDQIASSVYQPTAPGRPTGGYSATACWQTNFRRMATRATADPDFYNIAGSGVRALADEITSGVSA